MRQGRARLGSARVGSADAPWHLFNGRRLALDFLIRLAGGKVLVEELKGGIGAADANRCCRLSRRGYIKGTQIARQVGRRVSR
jgi:hypothetical protein